MIAVESVERTQLTTRPAIKPGDTVRVHVKVREGDKERIQVFEGMVIGMHRGGARATFTVRKVSFGQGVERIFPLHSPIIDKIEVIRTAQVRRAKLYFLRELKGKAARMKERKRPTRLIRGRASAWPRSARSARWRTPSGAWASSTWPAWTKWAAAAWPARSSRPRSSSIPRRYVPRICDSKTVTALEREQALPAGSRAPRSPGASRPPTCGEIDTINIHQASLRAMQRAVQLLAPCPDFVLVDAFRIPDLLMAQRAVIHGDSRCTAIAAASIVAKVTRDRMMLELHGQRPPLRVRPAQGLRDQGPPAGGRAVRLLRRPQTVVPSAVAV